MFLIVDDIIDKSETRRGQPCWYKIEEVGMISINDAFMIENGIYHILKKYFSEKDYYLKLIELFHEVIFKTFLYFQYILIFAFIDSFHNTSRTIS